MIIKFLKKIKKARRAKRTKKKEKGKGQKYHRNKIRGILLDLNKNMR